MNRLYYIYIYIYILEAFTGLNRLFLYPFRSLPLSLFLLGLLFSLLRAHYQLYIYYILYIYTISFLACPFTVLPTCCTFI